MSGELDLTFHALSDASRRTMVEQLSRGPASVSELATPLALSLPLALKHLAVLERGGLVRSDKLGRVRTFRIEPSALARVEQWVTQRRTSWNERFDRLERMLDAKPRERR